MRPAERRPRRQAKIGQDDAKMTRPGMVRLQVRANDRPRLGIWCSVPNREVECGSRGTASTTVLSPEGTEPGHRHAGKAAHVRHKG